MSERTVIVECSSCFLKVELRVIDGGMVITDLRDWEFGIGGMMEWKCPSCVATRNMDMPLLQRVIRGLMGI